MVRAPLSQRLAEFQNLAVAQPSVAGITSFDEDGETVVFEDGTKRQFDVIVFATGYRQRFPFLFPRPIAEQDGDGWVVGLLGCWGVGLLGCWPWSDSSLF